MICFTTINFDGEKEEFVCFCKELCTVANDIVEKSSNKKQHISEVLLKIRELKVIKLNNLGSFNEFFLIREMEEKISKNFMDVSHFNDHFIYIGYQHILFPFAFHLFYLEFIKFQIYRCGKNEIVKSVEKKYQTELHIIMGT